MLGFVLKKDQKKEREEEQISLEDLIEREVLVFLFISSVHFFLLLSFVELFLRLVLGVQNYKCNIML